MRRRLSALAATVPIAVAGLLATHHTAYLWTTAGAGERAHVLASTGHGYLATVQPVLMALAGLMLLAALCARLRARAGAVISPRLLASVPPMAFMLQEALERVAHDGTIPLHLFAEPAVVVGLVLQVPFALTGYLCGRLLLRVADRIGAVIRSAARGLRIGRSPIHARVADRDVVPLPAPPCGRATGRGPPVPVPLPA